MTPALLARAIVAVPAWPLAAAAALGAWWALVGKPSERVTARVVVGSLGLQLASALCALVAFVWGGGDAVHVRSGRWFEAGAYGFELTFLVDALSAPLVVLAALLTFLVAWFSVRYLHREPGFFRFFTLLAVFAAGAGLLFGGGSYDMLFIGWELVGLTSALLIGFFHERRTPMRAALRAITTYRVCDIGLVVGAVFIHDVAHGAAYVEAFGPAPWPHGTLHASAPAATLIVLCLLVAASGKSALLPVGTWLPRAVEGPTPSSALYYCALSVHAGAYLLLRSTPFLRASPVGAACVAAVGLGSAALASMIGRAQVDAKGAIAWASMTHVGLIVAEIGLGFPRVALVHLVAHALLRTWQMLRAPSWLHDELALRAAADGAPLPTGSFWQAIVPARALDALYRLAYDRFFFETAQQRYVAGPVLRLGRYLDRAERRWVETVGAWHPPAAPPDSERPSAKNTRVEEAQHEP